MTSQDQEGSPQPPAASGDRPRGSLTRHTLLRMGVRVALVIVVLTVASYLHVKTTVTRQTLDGLGNYIQARGEREQWIFDLALDNLRAIDAELVKRVRDYDAVDPEPEFERRYAAFPDGAVRSRREVFDPARHAGMAIHSPERLDTAAKRRVLASQDTIEQMGRALHTRFQNTWMILPENISLGYWPERPEWPYETKVEQDFTKSSLFQVASPDGNPGHESVWTDIYRDRATGAAMVSVARPVYDGGRFIGMVAHDVTLTELLDRTVNVRLENTWNFIVQGGGNLIAHPMLAAQIEQAGGGFHVSKAGDPALEWMHRAAASVVTAPAVVEDEPGDNYLGVVRLRGPDWLLVTVYPKVALQRAAFRVARFVLLGGILSLALEVGILFLVLRAQVAAPLAALLDAIRRVTAGRTEGDLPTGRDDELGELARSFSEMAQAVRDREERFRRDDAEIRRLNGDLAQALIGEREKIEALQRLRDTVDVLSIPVLEIWDDVLALPLIGVIDERRGDLMMERLLDAVVRTQCRLVLIDVTGVPMIDAPIAARILKVVAAVRLLGARCELTGVSGPVARTLIELGVDLGTLTTERSLKEGLRASLRRAGPHRARPKR